MDIRKKCLYCFVKQFAGNEEKDILAVFMFSCFYTAFIILCYFIVNFKLLAVCLTFVALFWCVKVKCTLVQAFRLCTGRTVHRASGGIALLFLDHGTRRGWGVDVTPRPLFTPGKDPVPIVQGVGWAPVPIWTGVENLAPTGIRSPDHPACSQLLYRLHYPAHAALFWFR